MRPEQEQIFIKFFLVMKKPFPVGLQVDESVVGSMAFTPHENTDSTKDFKNITQTKQIEFCPYSVLKPGTCPNSTKAGKINSANSLLVSWFSYSERHCDMNADYAIIKKNACLIAGLSRMPSHRPHNCKVQYRNKIVCNLLILSPS